LPLNKVKRPHTDDTQLLASSKPQNVPAMRQQLGSCVTDVSHWCAARRLQLNFDKTEAIWIGSKAAINKLTPQDRSLTVSNDTTIDSTDVVRDLGVFLNTELSMKQHIAE